MTITPDGEVVTNNHVITGATGITGTLFNSTEDHPATLLGHDAPTTSPSSKVDNIAGLPTVTLGDSSQTRLGDDVVAIGNALNLPGGPTATTGIILAVGRTLPDPRQPQNGEVVGMNTLVIQAANAQELARNLGFAIPVNNIKPLIPDLANGINATPTTGAPPSPT